MAFVKKIYKYITDNHLVDREDNVLAAVSGGVDSSVMLNVLNILKSDLGISLGVAHFNHKLRSAEADRDEEFVRSMAAKLSLDFHRGEWNDKKRARGSIQMQARETRFDYLNSLCGAFGYNKIAMGHNYEDNIETVLISLFSGYGLKGISGIQPRSGNRIHPLLSVSRNEIQGYAVSMGLSWVEDSTNAENKYLRNRIRNILIPDLRKCDPDFERGIIRIALEAEELNREIEADIENIWKTDAIRRQNSDIILEIDGFLQYFSVLRKYLIIDIFTKFAARRRPTPGILKEIDNLCRSETGSVVFYSDIKILKDREKLVFSNRLEDQIQHTLIIGESNKVGGWEILLEPVDCNEVQYNSDPTIEYIDIDRLSGSLSVRNWREGDRFRPLGMTGEMKISDFFTNNKLSLFEKNRILIIQDKEKIVWVCGMRLDERVTICKNSRNCLKLMMRSIDVPELSGK